MKRFVLYVILAVAFIVTSCSVTSEESDITPFVKGKYGSLVLGEEQMPINFAQCSDNGSFVLVILSPLADMSNLTTSVIVGLKAELFDREVDVERYFCNDDYIVIYEDPQYYYAPFRPLQSGRISIIKSATGVKIDIDVVLYDGTKLNYSHLNIPLE